MILSLTSCKLKQWRKNYSKQEKVQKHIQDEEDVEMLFTPEQVDAYYKNYCWRVG